MVNIINSYHLFQEFLRNFRGNNKGFHCSETLPPGICFMLMLWNTQSLPHEHQHQQSLYCSICKYFQFFLNCEHIHTTNKCHQLIFNIFYILLAIYMLPPYSLLRCTRPVWMSSPTRSSPLPRSGSCWLSLRSGRRTCRGLAKSW